MDLRHIRYFLAVAEEGNFTRAAAKLGIAQPPLSQQIRDLEREVGAALFHRIPQGAELTEAGQAFHARVAGLPGLAQDALEAARRAARGETGELILGFTATVVLNPMVPALIRSFRRDWPEVHLRLVEANSARLREELLAGRIDVGILRTGAEEPRELVHHLLAEEPLVAAVPRSLGPAPSEAPLDLRSVAHLPMILTPREIGAGLHDAALATCRAAGVEPVIGQLAPQIPSMLSLVSAELGFSLVPESMRQLAIENIAYRRLAAPGGSIGMAVAVMRGPLAPAMRNFVDLARAAAHAPSGDGSLTRNQAT